MQLALVIIAPPVIVSASGSAEYRDAHVVEHTISQGDDHQNHKETRNLSFYSGSRPDGNDVHA